MSHITEFVVEGLAGRKDLVAEKLNPHVNVFFGLNGSGKTSLLKIFHSAMAGDATGLRHVPFHRAEIKIYSITYDKIFTRVCDKKRLDEQPSLDELRRLSDPISVAEQAADAKPTEPELKWRDLTPPPKGQAQSWRHLYLPTTRLYLSDRVRVRPGAPATMGLSEEQLEEAFANLVNAIWSTYSASVLGHIQKAQAEGLADILRDILGEARSPSQDAQMDPPAVYQRVARFLERQGSKASLGTLATFLNNYSTNPQLRNVVSDINNVELKIQEATAPREKLQSTIANMFTGNKKVVFKDSSIEIVLEGDAKIGLGRLSSGEQQLLRILIDVLLAEGGSFIIDEPELSMHVDWQRNLIGAMRQLSPGAQLILATHSPEIMSDVKDENIFRL